MEVIKVGALQGTLTYKLFYVDGELEKDFKDTLVERVQERAFEPLDAEAEEEERYGWVPIENPLRVEFDLYNILFDQFINLGLRQDKWGVPSGLMKAHVAQGESEYMIEHNKERLSKFEREDIKAMVYKKLKEKSWPRMKVVDMSWDTESGRVRFWSQSPKTCELFQGLFEDTFGLALKPASPYINALHAGLTPEQIGRLADIAPSEITLAAGVVTPGNQ